MARFANLSKRMSCKNKPINQKNAYEPSDLKKGNSIKGILDGSLHFADRLRSWGLAVSSFCSTPILFYEVNLAMILRIEVAQMSTRLDQLLELRTLRHEIGLEAEDPPAAAIHMARGALEVWALSWKPYLRPQLTLANYLLHALEPTEHGRVVVREIKELVFTGR